MPAEMNPLPGPPDKPGKAVFLFEGRSLQGVPGEPIAKALFRAGIRTLSYSVKYHRPRGIHCGRGRCGMCHMEVDGIPGVPTCVTPLEDGMRVRREDFRPFFAPLLAAAARVLPLPAGFYYRVLTKPTFIRNFFVGNLRKMAGVGRLTMDPASGPSGRPDALARLKPAYDVIVVGAGLSGMAAAISAAGSASSQARNADRPWDPGRVDTRVLLIDEYGSPGGHSIGHQDEGELLSEIDRLAGEVTQHPAIEYVPGTLALGFYPPGTLLVSPSGGSPASRGAIKRIKSGAFVFAPGACDMIPLFENNELPGIFGSRAIRLLLERDGYPIGGTAVVYGTGEELERTVSLLHSKGIEVSAVMDAKACMEEIGDQRAEPSPARRFPDARLVSANGRAWIRSATFTRFKAGGEKVTIPCDLLCLAFRGQPAYELTHQAKFEFSFSKSSLDSERVMIPIETERSDPSGTAYVVVGEAAGETDWRRKIEQGKRGGNRAASAAAALTGTGEKR